MIISRIFAVFFFVIGFVGVFFEGKLVGKDLFIYLNTIWRLFWVLLIFRYVVGFFLRIMILIYFFCLDIFITVEEREVKDLLMIIFNIGNLYVKKEGDCVKFIW